MSSRSVDPKLVLRICFEVSRLQSGWQRTRETPRRCLGRLRILLRANGVVQVATGTAGAGTLLLGASLTVAALPLSTWVAVGLVAVATLNVLIYVKSGGDRPLDEYERTLRESRRKQFKLDDKGRILMPGEEVVLGKVDPSSGSPDAGATCRLARKLGALHEIAKQARVGSKMA